MRTRTRLLVCATVVAVSCGRGLERAVELPFVITPVTADVWEAVQRHKAHVEATGELAERRFRRVVEELRSIVARRLEERARTLLGREGLDRLEGDVVGRHLDPWAAADEVLATLDREQQ